MSEPQVAPPPFSVWRALVAAVAARKSTFQVVATAAATLDSPASGARAAPDTRKVHRQVLHTTRCQQEQHASGARPPSRPFCLATHLARASPQESLAAAAAPARVGWESGVAATFSVMNSRNQKQREKMPRERGGGHCWKVLVRVSVAAAQCFQNHHAQVWCEMRVLSRFQRARAHNQPDRHGRTPIHESLLPVCTILRAPRVHTVNKRPADARTEPCAE